LEVNDNLEKYKDNSALYFSTLEQLRRHAETTRKKESEEEKKLIEYLPVNEKFSFNKEGKVLTRWQERQRDWNRIQLQIERKLRSKIKRPLMMTTADEYRAKLEELDLLQASVPDEDRFNESSWQAGLRGGGAIRQPVGHIFSGLECKYEQALPRPTLVRKPKVADFVGKNDTFVEQSEKYVETRKKYGKYYRSIRPHDLTYSEAHHLVIRSTDLFQWARQSSEAYFVSRSDAALTLNTTAGEETNLSVAVGEEIDGAGSTDHLHDIRVDFLSSRELSFDAFIGHQSMVQVQFKNTGATSVAYKWRSMLPEHSDTSHSSKHVDKSRITIVDRSELKPGTAGDKHTLKDVLANRNSPSIRAHVLSQQRDHFFCLKDAGEVLPDDVVTTTFVFKSRAGGGSFSAQWMLEFVPDTTKVYHVATNQPLPGSIVCSLRGHCFSADESLKKRSFVSSYIEQATVQTMATDIVFHCLKRVRDPVRRRDVHQRQIDLFRSMNRQLLASIDKKFGSASSTFITISRLDKFCSLYLKALELFDKISDVSRSLRDKRFGKWPSTASKVGVGSDGSESANPLRMSQSEVDAIKLQLFPEKFIEIFDEIAEADYHPRWNYDLSSVLTSLSLLQQTAGKVQELEDEIAILEAADLKEKLKVQRKADRLAALESDEEYEEEEEEEEEPLDEEEVVEQPLHPLVAEVRTLSSSLCSGIQLLLVHELPMDSIALLASEIISEIAEKIVDSHDAALIEAEIIDPMLSIPSIASPFTTDDGKEAWRDILEYKPAPTELDSKVKGGKPPSKPVKGAAAAPVELTPMQVKAFYKAMFDGVRASSLEISGAMFAAVDEFLSSDTSTKVYSSKVSRDVLFDLSVVRKVDLTSIHSGKVAFLNWDGDAFAEQDRVSSAFNVAETNKVAAIQPILKLVQYEAQAIVLLYESNLTASAGAASSIIPYVDEISTLIQARYEEHKLANDKLLKKNKQKPSMGHYKKLSILKFASFAEFYLEMDQLLNRPDYDMYFSETIPIVVLENIAIPGVVPAEPDYEEMVSDDEDAPVVTGLQESILYKRKMWDSKRPHRVKVTVNIGNSSHANRDRSRTAVVECFADPSSAISEAYYQKPSIRPHDVLWVECCGAKIFDPKSSFDELHVDGRYVSEQIREMFIWVGIFQILPTFAEFLVDEKSVSRHIGKLFPASAESKAAPTSTVVLGGSIRPDKLCVLDQLLDVVDTVVLCGELALAFLSISSRCVLEKYKFSLTNYRDACLALLTKAKMKGCRIVLPVDLIVGDQTISDEDKLKCFQKFELDARNEGVEYEGETKVFECGSSWVEGGESVHDTESNVTSGFAYDIGPKSCQVLQDILATTELLLVWGLVGVCESSSFQSGQATLINSSKADGDVATNSTRKSPLQTVLIGDSTVEWYARMLDSDGELNGDLVGAGLVAYSLRTSSILAGAMGMFASRTVQSKLKLRPSLEDEWVYSQKKIEEDEDEEDEEDEDEES